MNEQQQHTARRLVRVLGLSIAGVVALTATAWAQAEGYDANALSSEGFQTAAGSGSEEVPGGAFMLAAYVAFFALLGGYAFQLARKQARVQREFGDLRKAVEDIDDQLAELGGDKA
jgi:CcmD family protein